MFYVIAEKGQLLPLSLTMYGKITTSYLMTYICYPFTNNVKYKLLGATVNFFIIMKLVYLQSTMVLKVTV